MRVDGPSSVLAATVTEAFDAHLRNLELAQKLPHERFTLHREVLHAP